MSAMWVTVGPLAAIPEQKIFAFAAAGSEWILIRQGDQLSAFVDVCSHQDVKLSEFGEIQQGHLICHAHGAVFHCQSGQPLCFPASTSLQAIPVRVSSGIVEIQPGGFTPADASVKV